MAQSNDRQIDISYTRTGQKIVLQPRSQPETVLLIGTGAVENSWEPVTRALQSVVPYVPEGEENLAFASIVYDLRHLAYIVQRLRFGFYGLSPGVRQQLNSALGRYERLVCAISLRNCAERQMRSKSALVHSFTRFVSYSRSIATMR